MATITPPNLDPQDEDTLVATAINNLPAELSDRNSASIAVKLLEACGAFYGALVKQLNLVPDKLYLTLLALLGLTLTDATSATTTLQFSAATSSGATVPAGTVVKTGTGADAVKFTTDTALASTDFAQATIGGTPIAGLYLATVTATCATPGIVGNVVTGLLTYLEQPISGVTAVTNTTDATGGTDTETLDSLKARAPDVIRANSRAITLADFETLATDNVSVVRAIAAGASGAVTVHILATDLNQTPDATVLQPAVQTALQDATIPGVAVTINQYPVRLIKITSIEVAYATGANQAMTQANIVAALAAYLDATTWAYGDLLYLNEVVAVISEAGGVKRVGTIKFEYSDDYGTNWSTEATMGNAGLDPGGTPSSIPPNYSQVSAPAYNVFQFYGGTAYPSAPAITFVTL